MKILLVGPQGSGKTTQSQLLSQKMGLCMIIIGEMLRKRALANDSLGNQIKKDQMAGVLVADKHVATILKEELTQPDCQKGFIIDGWPRTLPQLELFDPGYELVLNLSVSEDVAVQRLTKRGRLDDIPEAIKKRLAIYYKQTRQVLEKYQQQKLVVQINGNGSIEEVEKQIENAVKAKFGPESIIKNEAQK